MEPLALARLIRSHQSDIESGLWVDRQQAKIQWVLYGAIVCSAARDSYGSGKSWGLCIILPGNMVQGDVLGKRLSLLSSEAQIISGLDALREYAELVLPKEYQEVHRKRR